MEHWYVYYKLPADSLPDLLPGLRAVVQQVACACGGSAQLQSRIDVRDGMATVMEVYPQVSDPDRLATCMQAALAASSLPLAVTSGRHVERFRDL